MAEAIRMPLLSDTMKEGKIVAWHKKVGDSVKSDDVIAEVETDKATMEVMPYADGTLLYIGTPEGQAARVNDIIAIVGKQGENYDALLKEGAAPAGGEGKPKDAGQPAAANNNGNSNAAPQQQQAPAQQETPQQPAAAAPKPGDATVVRMPLLSDTMKEGKIVAWHKKVGDTVKSDDVVAEVETDKATMEVMPYADGTLLYIGVKEGEAAKINDIIAIVGKPGTDVAPYLNEGAPAGGGDSNTAPQQQAQQPQQPAAGDNGATPQQAAPAQQQQPQAAEAKDDQHANSDERVKASPLAKRMAEDKGIDLHQLKGSGDNGRIVKRDIDEYKPAAQAAPQQQQGDGKQPATAPQQQFTAGEDRTVPLSQMRKVIAQRLSESMYSAPHFYLHSTITMDKAMEARKVMNEASPVKISFNDLIIKACAMALRQHPEVNSSWMGDSIRINGNINIGSAIAIEEGLIVPVVKNADQKTLSQISAEAASLYDKARTKKLQPQEFSGNTFTISNLGMMDIDEFTAIINPPDSCILAVGKIVPTPVVEDGQVVIRQLLKLTMSCDHRVVDGAVGARFLQTLKAYLQNPVTMLV